MLVKPWNVEVDSIAAVAKVITVAATKDEVAVAFIAGAKTSAVLVKVALYPDLNAGLHEVLINLLDFVGEVDLIFPASSDVRDLFVDR